MGVVYEAIQVSLGRRVALKMILNAEGASPTALRRFTLEAATVARLDHPNIVPLYEIGEVNGQPFLSMKLIPGETLLKKMARGEIGLKPNKQLSRDELKSELCRIAQLLIKTAQAVDHAHENGILHRDLKPGNILVDNAGEPHLLDFGLAKILPGEASLNELSNDSKGTPGTPNYMSPEQAEGKPLTKASDIHSLGVILYELLCGAPPFTAGTPIETLRKVIQHHPTRPRMHNVRIDKDLDTICMKCLEKIPAARYPSARALAEDLDRWLRQRPIQARPAGLPLRFTRWVARNRLGAALIASLCLGLGISLALLRQALERQRNLDLRHANSLQLVSGGIEEMWKDPEKSSIKIASATLADMADFPPHLSDPLSVRLTLGNVINHEPFGQALQYAPFLHELEARLEKALNAPVLVDLSLYKFERDALYDLSRGKVQIQRMSSVAYVLAQRRTPGLQPLVQERTRREGVIFARKDLGITNLAQLQGMRLALGQATSDYTFWGKVHLARAGILSATLRSCTYMRGEREETTRRSKKMSDRDPNLQAYKQVIFEVVNGGADVGVAPRRQFELSKFKKGGLVELHSFPVSGELYVGSPDLSPELAKALQESFTSFTSVSDKTTLARLGENSSPEGFVVIKDESFAEIRTALDKELAAFDLPR